MDLIQDRKFEEGVGTEYGKYLGTFVSARRQVRVDVFDEGPAVVAHVSFPTGLRPSTVQDRYVADLHDYARREGLSDRFRIVFAQ